MSQLQQQRATGAKEDQILTRNPPHHRNRTKDSFYWACRDGANELELPLKFRVVDQRDGHGGCL